MNANTLKYVPEAIVTAVREISETADVAKVLDRMPTERLYDDASTCKVCGKVFGRGQHLNFAKASHAAMHVRKGEALDVYGGWQGIHVMPTVEKVVAYMKSVYRQKEIQPLREQLKAEIAPIVAAIRQERGNIAAREGAILAAARARGRAALTENYVLDSAEDLQLLLAKVAELNAQQKAVMAKYDEDVVRSLTFGDFA